MVLFYRIPILFFLLLLQGCAWKSKENEPEMASFCPVGVEVENALAREDFEEGDWPSDAWWRSYEDPVLNQLIETALEISPTLQVAEARLKAAYQVALQQRASLFPEMDLNLGTNWQHLSTTGFFRNYAPTIPPVVNDVNFNLSFFYEFDFWGKNRMLFDAALAETAARLAQKKQAELILSTSIAYTYVELQLLYKEKAILQKMEQNNHLITRIRDQRVKNAIDSVSQKLFSETKTLDSIAALLEIEEKIQNNIHKLKALAGLGQDADLAIPYKPLVRTQMSLPNNLSLDLIARRPDLTAQKAFITAAAKKVGAARTDFYPNVNLLAFVGLESVVWPKLFTKKGAMGALQPAINLPIFTAGRIAAHLHEEMEYFNEAVFAYNDMILHIAREIADRLTTITQLQKLIAVRVRSLQIVDEELHLSLHRFEEALSNKIDVTLSTNELLNAELTLAFLTYGKELANIGLIQALGGGYHE